MIEEQGIGHIAVVMDETKQILRKVKDGKNHHKKKKGKGKGSNGKQKMPMTTHKNDQDSSDEEEDIDDSGNSSAAGHRHSKTKVTTKSKSKQAKDTVPRSIAPLPARARSSPLKPRPTKRKRRDPSEYEDDQALPKPGSVRNTSHPHPRQVTSMPHPDPKGYINPQRSQPPFPPPLPSTRPRQRSDASSHTYHSQQGHQQLTPIFEGGSHHQPYPSIPSRRHTVNQYHPTGHSVQSSYPRSSQPHRHPTSNSMHNQTRFDIGAPQYQSRFAQGSQVLHGRYDEYEEDMYHHEDGGYDDY